MNIYLKHLQQIDLNLLINFYILAEEKNISNTDSLKTALLFMFFMSVICVFGLNIEYGSSGRRAYRLYDAPYLYFIFIFSVFAVFSCLNIVFHFIRSRIRNHFYGNRT